MDDLWGNAWNEPVKTKTTEVKKNHSEDSWASPNTDVELNIPSWTKNTVGWDSNSISTGSTWAGGGFSSSIDDGWGASILEGVNETREQDEIAPAPLKSPVLGSSIDEVDAREADTKTNSPPESPVAQAATHESVSTPRPPSPERLDILSPNDSITVATSDEWAPALTSPIAPDAEWGSPWGGAAAEQGLQSHTTTANQSDRPVDEWERAVQEKKMRDTKMPPEVMSSIMAHFEELSAQLWPGVDLASVRDHAAARSEWEGGLENIEGLNAFLNRTIPVQVSLPPPIRFSKTKVSAAYLRSLRLTKSVPIMLNSPLSHLSKESAAWERAVKAQKDLDSYVMGWTPRVTEEEPTSTPTEKKGIFSFFSRKTTTGPEVGSPTPHTIPNSASPVVAGLAAIAKARGVSESPHPSAPNSPAALPGFEPTPSLVSVMSPVVSSTSAVSSPTPGSGPATSTVSRFLGRWSRSKAHSSISLDGNDLTFLENVPSYHDEDDAEDIESLQAALKAVNTNILPPTRSIENMSKDEFERTLEAQATLAFDEKLIDDFFFGELGNDVGSHYAPIGAKRNAPAAPRKQTTVSAAMTPTETGNRFSSLATSSSKSSSLMDDEFSSFMSISSSTRLGSAARPQPLSNTSLVPLAPFSTYASQSITSYDTRRTGLAELSAFDSVTGAPALPPKPATPPVLSPRLPGTPTPTGSPLPRGVIPPHKAVSLTPQSTGGTTRPPAMSTPIAPLLPPPPGMRPISRGPAVDLLGADAPPQKSQGSTPASLLMRFETPSSGSSVPSRTMSPPLVPFSSIPTTIRPSPAAAPKSNGTAEVGGLSAQDLSFFEGL